MGVRKPVIGIPVHVFADRHSTVPGVERAFVNQDYIHSVSRAGGLAVVLPAVHGREDVLAQLSLLDGLLFPGGADLSPLAYGEEPGPGLEDVFPDMDEHQLALARMARLPMLGICRGMQVLNVAFGGTLHQHLGDRPEPVLQHVQKGPRHAVSHTVDLVEGTLLHGLFGRPVVGTNSFHHQAVKRLAPGLRISARARDGVVEGFERTDGAFVLGVQWHPESMVEKHSDMLRVFEALVQACAGERTRTA